MTQEMLFWLAIVGSVCWAVGVLLLAASIWE